MKRPTTSSPLTPSTSSISTRTPSPPRSSMPCVHFVAFQVIEISMNRFTEMETYATRMLKITSKESQEALQQGLSTVFEKFLSKFVEEDLGPWETYCKEACLKVPAGLVLPEKFDASSNLCEDEDVKLDAELNSLRERKAAAEKETAELRRDIKALEAHVEAKASFMDAFDQLQNLPLIDDLGTAVRDLRKSVEEANALRAQRYQKLLFPANPSASGDSG
ncbi:hypothetical protein KC19_2G192500 [Ceratodon purpureus]|uniref:Uncharacterized protein n=1 Tax=Ceratodon purpureus TaxID=3225 RepID=A0A8T0IXQ0_CERPU|nr:hypothetical protein KC19_2G192500 [Ceratodon purpureus]